MIAHGADFWKLICTVSYLIKRKYSISNIEVSSCRELEGIKSSGSSFGRQLPDEKAYSSLPPPPPPPCHNGSQSWARPLLPSHYHTLSQAVSTVSSSSWSRSKSHFNQILNWQLLDIWGFNRTARFKLSSKCRPPPGNIRKWMEPEIHYGSFSFRFAFHLFNS